MIVRFWWGVGAPKDQTVVDIATITLTPKLECYIVLTGSP